MNKYIAALALAGVLAFPTVGHASSVKPGSGNGNNLGNTGNGNNNGNGKGNGNTGAHGCKPGSQGYVSSDGKCYHVPPPGGKFNVPVPGSNFVLQGGATTKTAGHQVAVTQVAPVVSKPKGDWFRVQSDGSFPPLSVQHAVIYQYDPKTGKLTRVKEITQPGIYVVVPSL